MLCYRTNIYNLNNKWRVLNEFYRYDIGTQRSVIFVSLILRILTLTPLISTIMLNKQEILKMMNMRKIILSQSKKNQKLGCIWKQFMIRLPNKYGLQIRRSDVVIKLNCHINFYLFIMKFLFIYQENGFKLYVFVICLKLLYI